MVEFRFKRAAQRYADAGFDRLVLMNAGPDPDGFIDFYRRELQEPMRRMPPGRVS